MTKASAGVFRQDSLEESARPARDVVSDLVPKMTP